MVKRFENIFTPEYIYLLPVLTQYTNVRHQTDRLTDKRKDTARQQGLRLAGLQGLG